MNSLCVSVPPCPGPLPFKDQRTAGHPTLRLRQLVHVNGLHAQSALLQSRTCFGERGRIDHGVAHEQGICRMWFVPIDVDEDEVGKRFITHPVAVDENGPWRNSGNRRLQMQTSLHGNSANLVSELAEYSLNLIDACGIRSL